MNVWKMEHDLAHGKCLIHDAFFFIIMIIMKENDLFLFASNVLKPPWKIT